MELPEWVKVKKGTVRDWELNVTIRKLPYWLRGVVIAFAIFLFLISLLSVYFLMWWELLLVIFLVIGGIVGWAWGKMKSIER